MTVMKQIVILISGSGSNMQAIARTAERDSLGTDTARTHRCGDQQPA